MRARCSAARLRSCEDGQSLIEVLIVIVIVAILSVGFITFVSATFNTDARAQQDYNKATSAQSALEWLNARIGAASSLGMISGGQINPLSIARDQLLFTDTTTSGSECYRVAYVKSADEVLIMTASSCTSASIAPERGPNTGTAATGSLCSGNTLASDVDPMFDIAPGQTLNCGSATFTGPTVLASNVVAAAPPQAGTGPNPLSLFTFENAVNQPLGVGGSQGPDEQASSSSSSSWYSTAANTAQISAVNATLYLDASASGDLGPAVARSMLITVGGV